MTINQGMFSSNTDLWSTPQDTFDALDKEFHFGLDVCATDDNNKCARYFTKEVDGLNQDWGG
jgi:site-specific DNA-methyltransferase (adenine-specific)